MSYSERKNLEFSKSFNERLNEKSPLKQLSYDILEQIGENIEAINKNEDWTYSIPHIPGELPYELRWYRQRDLRRRKLGLPKTASDEECDEKEGHPGKTQNAIFKAAYERGIPEKDWKLIVIKQESGIRSSYYDIVVNKSGYKKSKKIKKNKHKKSKRTKRSRKKS